MNGWADALRSVIREELNAVVASQTSGGSGTRYLTIASGASVAGVHPCTIREWIKDGGLKAYRIGRAYRLLRSDLDARLTAAVAANPLGPPHDQRPLVLGWHSMGRNGGAQMA
jgi:excisionase family DNA binding protein